MFICFILPAVDWIGLEGQGSSWPDRAFSLGTVLDNIWVSKFNSYTSGVECS